MRLLFATFLFISMAIYGYEVEFDCGEGEKCERYRKTVLPDLLDLSGHDELWQNLKNLAKDESIERFEVRAVRDSKLKYIVILKFKKRVSDLTIKFPSGDEDDLLPFVLQKVDQYYNAQLLDLSKKRMFENLKQRGYVKPLVSYGVKEFGDEVHVNFEVKTMGQKIVKKVSLVNEGEILDFETSNRLNYLENIPYDKLKITQVIEDIQRKVVESGHYKAKVEFEEKMLSDQDVELKINAVLGKKYNFSLSGNETVDTLELVNLLKQEFIAGNMALNHDEMSKTLKNFYEERSIYNTVVNIEQRSGLYRNNAPMENIYIRITEGRKLKITKLFFKGNQRIPLQKLEDLFYGNAPVIVERGYFEKKYVNQFSDIVKNHYLENGFLLSSVKTNTNMTDEGAEVLYSIVEGQKCSIRKVSISGVPAKLAEKIKSKLKNNDGKAFNVLALEEDIKSAINIVKEEGYYFASLKNYNPDKILNYYANYSMVDINLDFKSGKILTYNDLNIQGLIKTRSKTIRRENIFKPGEIITPTKLEKLNGKISALGLFSSISIKPDVLNKFSQADNYRTNINLFFKEKNPGTGIVAPGYRTDLGAKLSFNLLYRNLYGLNHAVSLKTQFNRRFSLGNLDARRKADKHQFLETLLNLNYSWPFFLDYFDFNVSSTFQRKRAFSFDADILRLSPIISKQFNDFFSSSLRYQLEDIRQTDATNEKDDARFRIGSLTPSMTFDFRDSPVAPKSGSYFNLSWEFGNPYFGAQKGKDFEINYSKFVSRNRFYLPVKDKIFVLALSVSAGYQVNYAEELLLDGDGSRILNSDNTYKTKGYIPSIKVFRLDGQDTVRGFSSSEINRLNNGDAISDVRVQNTAYFANLKFEPRYYLSDSIGLGLFFDAGRIYVNHFQPLSLRTSVGGSFKFLTPVGSLDFDYGVKVERRRLNDGGREGFGRFHLSIGLF